MVQHELRNKSRHLSRMLLLFVLIVCLCAPVSIALGEAKGANPATVTSSLIDSSQLDFYMSLSELENVQGLVYDQGSDGFAVKFIQQMLIEMAYLPQGSDDGNYSSTTKGAIERFQRDVGLTQTGVANVATQYMLSETYSGFSEGDGGAYYFAGLDNYGVVQYDSGFYVGVLFGDSYIEGTFYYPSGDTYAGTFQYNQRNGSGCAWFANGDYYEGEWQNDQMSGNGA